MKDAPPAASAPDVGHGRLTMERMLFFSDAVFAIVLTLLALDLRPPAGVDAGHIADGLVAMREHLIAFAVTFALVGVFWMAHVATLRALASFDWVVAGVNLAFLFTITLTPFASSLVARFGRESDAWRFYCAEVMAVSLAQGVLLWASHRDEPRILHPEHHGRLAFRLSRTSAPGVAFAVGLALSLAGLRQLASLCWVLVPLVLLAQRLLMRRTGASAGAAEDGDGSNSG